MFGPCTKTQYIKRGFQFAAFDGRWMLTSASFDRLPVDKTIRLPRTGFFGVISTKTPLPPLGGRAARVLLLETCNGG
jgi:hypothetical protein